MTASEGPQALDVLIIGAGFGGLCMLHKCRELGLGALAVEAAEGIGGTWHHNRYPGARCDIPSLEYSLQFSPELQQDWHWRERYATGAEILTYIEHVADRFGLRSGIRLGTRVTSARYDEKARRWLVEASSGERWWARFLVPASGPLSDPNLPAFKGLERFRGPVCHTGRWPREPVALAGRRVGVIGTGSSGVQVVSALAPVVAGLTVFQRTPAYVVPSHNRPLDPAYEARIKADYAGFRARNSRMRGGYGSEVPPRQVSALAVSAEERRAAFEERWRIGGFCYMGAFNDLMTNLASNTHAADFIRGKIREIVDDPATARLLSPSQPIGCKRLCLDNDYYATFNRPNVRLVDISGTGIEEVTETGVIAGGREHPLDVIILATGFDALTGALMEIDIRGRDGRSLAGTWRDGPRSYLGLMVAGFPNMFTIVGPGGAAPLTNVLVSIEHQVGWIGACLDHLARRGKSTIEAEAAAEQTWTDSLVGIAGQTLYVQCKNWYMGANVPGKPRVFMSYAGGFPAYTDICAEVAADGYRGFVLS